MNFESRILYLRICKKKKHLLKRFNIKLKLKLITFILFFFVGENSEASILRQTPTPRRSIHSYKVILSLYCPRLVNQGR